MLKSGEPDFDTGLGGVSFMGEELFCRSSRLLWDWPFLTYNFGRPGGTLSMYTGGFGGFSRNVDEADFRLRFSAWSFFVGIVSIGGGSGFVDSEGVCVNVELWDVRGEGSENGERMFLGKGANPRT